MAPASGSALLLKDLELGQAPAHLLLCAGGRYRTSDDCTKLQHAHHEYMQSDDLTRDTHQRAHPTEPQHPGNTILAIQRTVVCWIVVNIGIYDPEYDARRNGNL